jgi:hypothetical protein
MGGTAVASTARPRSWSSRRNRAGTSKHSTHYSIEDLSLIERDSILEDLVTHSVHETLVLQDEPIASPTARGDAEDARLRRALEAASVEHGFRIRAYRILLIPFREPYEG